MKPKISVVGAGNVGAEVARRIAEKDLGDVILVDVLEGIPQGKALDIFQSGSILGFTSQIKGTNDYSGIKDSQIVVVTAGLARKPGMSRDDLLAKNAEIVKTVVEKIKNLSKDSIILMVTNPLDSMAYLAWKVSGFETKRVLGMAPLLDAARMATFIAMELKVPVTEVKATVLGTHGDLMVPVPSQTTVSGKPITKLLSKGIIDQIIERTRNGGAEIVSFLKTGSAYYAPSAAVAHMVESMLKDKQEVIPSSVFARGEYGLKDLYIGLPAKLGKNGVEKIIEIELSEEEKQALNRSAEVIRENNRKCAKS
ncbi:malate dehydrogenase [candidate division WOR-1 bacterium DG_54_3]|uniref:Malate dehydrogenase n=1 Tax=candidate division WOR-1 bacterium DG_54_3 TaxID=1703775 RepID=A0A0S7Y4D3_UNCSA|nr:MAG: malate dehydrogenase [candidate division WOR-1 bacterium DG_54_3]